MGKLPALLCVLVVSHSAGAATTTIDPASFANGTNLSTLIPGVTLSEATASLDTAGPVITVPLHVISNFSGPIFAGGSNFVHSDGAIWSAGPCCAIHNALRADFADSVSRVSVEFHPDDNDAGVLQAYSAEGALLDDQFLIANHPFTLEIISTGTPIAFLLASYGDSGLIGAITLESSPVPLPSALALMAIGLAGFGRSIRRDNGARAGIMMTCG